MTYGIEEKILTQVLGGSIYWEGNGPKGEPALTTGERIQIARKIAKDLRESHEFNGEEFFSELWLVVRQALGTCNWFQRGATGVLLGPWVLWRVIYKKASRLAEQKIKARAKSNPSSIGAVVNQAAQELKRNIETKALEACGAMEKFE